MDNLNCGATPIQDGDRLEAQNDPDEKLPSLFQLGQIVKVFGASGRITGICFREGQISYEVRGLFVSSDQVEEL